MNSSPHPSRFSCLCLLLFGVAFLGPPLANAAGTPSVPQVGGVTLAECYQKARQISETVGISAENARLVQEW